MTPNHPLILTLKPPFPIDAFPPAMQTLLQSLSQTHNLPLPTLALPLLTIAGGAIGNSRRLQLSADYSVPPNIWSAILAPTDMPNLTRAIQLILAPLIIRQQPIIDYAHQLHTDHAEEFRAWKYSRNESPRPLKPLPPPTDHRQIFFTDADYRRIPDYLARQRRGCLFIQNDLTPWFKTTPIEILSLFDATPFTFDRAKSLRARFAPHPFIAITGSVSPDSLFPRIAHSAAVGQRLASRFLLTAPPQTQHAPTLSSISPEITSTWEEILFRLHNLEPELSTSSIKPRIIPLHRKAKTELTSAQTRLTAAAQAESNPALQSHLMNLIDYIPRIALISQFSAPREECYFDVVDGYSLTCATKLIEYFSEETKQIHARLATDSTFTQILTAITLIARRGGSITARQLQQASTSFRHSAEHARTFLQNLAKEGLGSFTYNSHDHGRSPTFHLDPTIYSNSKPSGAIENSPTVTTLPKNPP